MNILLENEDKLNLSWSPNCFYIGNGKYSVGPIGRLGPGVDPDNIPPWISPKVEDIECLSFFIFIKECNPYLYKQIKQAILGLEDENIQIIYLDYRTIEEQVGVKEEYKETYKKCVLNNNRLDEEVERVLGELRKLVHLVELDYSINGKLPISYDWFIYEGKIDETRAAGMEIRCVKGTKFYQFLQDNGLVEKYYPAWYKKGNF